MLKCARCKEQFPLVKELLLHIRKNCKFIVRPCIEYTCGQENCHRQYSSIDSFRRHLKAKHFSDLGFSITSESSFEDFTPSGTFASPQKGVFNIVQNNATEVSKSEVEESFDATAGFLASLYVNPIIPRSTVQVVIDALKNLHHTLAESIELKFSSLLKDGVSIEVTTALRESLLLLKDTVQPFQSEYKRLQIFTDLGTYIPSKEVVLGYRRDTRQRHGKLALHSSPSTMEVIPLRRVMHKFFSIEIVWKQTIDYVNSLTEKGSPGQSGLLVCIENVIQGTVWRRKHGNCIIEDDEGKVHTLVLPLFVFYDDFEIGNPLGSHATIHKLGGLYVSLPVLPPYWASLLDHTFLLALCHSSDRAHFGNKSIFRASIDELNFLQETGIAMNTSFFQGVLKFSIVALVGDNLGLNQILGMTESFAANHCCRVCTVDKQSMRTIALEDETLLRNMGSYHEQLSQQDVSKTGLKQFCCWLEVRGFDMFTNVGVDAMHDVLEGVARYVMVHVINHLVSKCMPHYNTLQQKLSSFDYGPDNGSKPISCISKEGQAIKLKTSSAEMMTLVRYFGLIAGYYVPRGEEIWELYIYLRRILERLLNHRVFEDTVEQLKYLIRDFNEAYCRLTGEDLKPKFHFLVHYPAMLKKFGPLRNLWSMRFEAKHRVFKMAARASSNRRNVCKSLAMKNQFILNDLFLKNKLPPLVCHGKKGSLPEAFPNVDEGITHSVDWVKTSGVFWRVNDVVTVNISEETDFPQFAIIESILLTASDKIYFFCSSLETLVFDDHYYAWEVVRSGQSFIHEQNTLFGRYPNTLTILRDYSMMITVRWPID